MDPQKKVNSCNRPLPVPLRAGPLNVLYDNGMLRSICFGPTEIVRRIYMALRDEHWNTIPYRITSLNIESRDTSFVIRFKARHNDRGIIYVWDGTVSGSEEGVITAALDGCAESTFLRKRIGWCLLYPLELCKSAPCEVTLEDGSVCSTFFPADAIAPHEPFLPFTNVWYSIGEGVGCNCSFSGDLFEMEDQRNWTDGSFKTYSTPQSLPTPVCVAQGEHVKQTITVALTGIKPPLPCSSFEGDELLVDVDALSAGLKSKPRFGIGSTLEELFSNSLPLDYPFVADFYRIDIDASRPLPDGLAESITRWCKKYSAKVEIALYLTAHYHNECRAIAPVIAVCSPLLERVLVLLKDGSLTSEETFTTVKKLFASIVDERLFVRGTDRYFVEINRANRDDITNKNICFSANPQVHTFDDSAIMENLTGLEECIAFAKTIAGSQSVVLSPLTLRPRKNPLKPAKDGGADGRQDTLFTAVWLIGALGASIRAGITSCTIFSACSGPEGLLDSDALRYFPVYHVFTSGIGNAQHCNATLVGSPAPQLATIFFYRGDTAILLLANCTDSIKTVTIKGLPSASVVSLLDKTTLELAESTVDFWRATRGVPVAADGKLLLDGYSVARIALLHS